jgi:hypothetical protein
MGLKTFWGMEPRLQAAMACGCPELLRVLRGSAWVVLGERAETRHLVSYDVGVTEL